MAQICSLTILVEEGQSQVLFFSPYSLTHTGCFPHSRQHAKHFLRIISRDAHSHSVRYSCHCPHFPGEGPQVSGAGVTDLVSRGARKSRQNPSPPGAHTHPPSLTDSARWCLGLTGCWGEETAGGGASREPAATAQQEGK